MSGGRGRGEGTMDTVKISYISRVKLMASIPFHTKRHHSISSTTIVVLAPDLELA